MSKVTYITKSVLPIEAFSVMGMSSVQDKKKQVSSKYKSVKLTLEEADVVASILRAEGRTMLADKFSSASVLEEAEGDDALF